MTETRDTDEKLDWLARTPLGELEAELARRLAAAFEAGHREGYEVGSRVAADRVHAAFQEGEAAATARLASDFERKLSAWEASRAEATLKEAEERGLAFERLMRERERAIEARMQARLDDARRKGIQEGAQAGPRRSLGIEGSRSWALGVLHLNDGATFDEIRQRFRKLSLLMHPDRQPGLDDAYIKNLQRARDILGG